MKDNILTLEQKVDIAIGKIFLLCNQINRKTDFCVFIDDSGHIESIRIRLSESKMKYNEKQILFECYYSNSGKWAHNGKDSDERLKRLEDFVSTLEVILKERKIDYSLFIPVYERVLSYYETI